MDKAKLALYALIILGVGYGFGYYLAPDKVRVEERIVEKEKIIKEENKKVTEKFDPSTGKVVERIEETGKKETNVNTNKKEKIEEKIKDKKLWAAKGGVATNLRDPGKLVPRVGAEVRLPIFNSWVGVEADIDVNRPLVGGYLRVEF